jgi:hypothetical protein
MERPLSVRLSKSWKIMIERLRASAKGENTGSDAD